MCMSSQTICTGITRCSIKGNCAQMAFVYFQSACCKQTPSWINQSSFWGGINQAKNRWVWTNKTRWLIWRYPTEIFYKALSFRAAAAVGKTNSERRSLATSEPTMVNGLYLRCAFVIFDHSGSELKHALRGVKTPQVSSSSCTDIQLCAFRHQKFSLSSWGLSILLQGMLAYWLKGCTVWLWILWEDENFVWCVFWRLITNMTSKRWQNISEDESTN